VTECAWTWNCGDVWFDQALPQSIDVMNLLDPLRHCCIWHRRNCNSWLVTCWYHRAGMPVRNRVMSYCCTRLHQFAQDSARRQSLYIALADCMACTGAELFGLWIYVRSASAKFRSFISSCIFSINFSRTC